MSESNSIQSQGSKPDVNGDHGLEKGKQLERHQDQVNQWQPSTQKSSSTKKFFVKAFSFGDVDLYEKSPIVEGCHVVTKHHKKTLNRGLSFGPTRPGLHGGSNIRWFHNLFPLRQVFVPRVAFPLWDDNWDGNKSNRIKLGERPSRVVTRHVMLVRHGQYDEEHAQDHRRVLTDLGKLQAKKTGERLAEMIRNSTGSSANHCPLKLICSSSLTRAKQTADIIYQEMEAMASGEQWELVERNSSDPDLNEGFPCHHIPGPTGFTGLRVEEVDRDFPRLEEAFQKYIGTSDWLEGGDLPRSKPVPNPKKKGPRLEHEYEIVVGAYVSFSGSSIDLHLAIAR